MVKKIFKGIWKVLVWTVNLIGMIIIYTVFMAAMFGKGKIDYHIPFTDEAKTLQWDNSGGSK